MIPGFPPPASGIRYSFRCEAVTDCQIGAVALDTLIENALRIASAAFKRMVASYSRRWDLVQLRCANFMSCTLEERVVLILLELTENFRIHDRQGVRLTVPPRHRDFAELVGASRPRVTEYLAQLERDHFFKRDGRQLIGGWLDSRGPGLAQELPAYGRSRPIITRKQRPRSNFTMNCPLVEC